jgi:carboxymethylenebutenolidase
MQPATDIAAVFDEHEYAEFVLRDAAKALETMVREPSVRLMPTQLGGEGRDAVLRFYGNVFIPSLPGDIELIRVSRTLGIDRLVDEDLVSFTHTAEIPWLLPQVSPTGKRIEAVVIVLAEFENGKLARERVYWDQGSVLAQVGLLESGTLPVSGNQAARVVRGRIQRPDAAR